MKRVLRDMAIALQFMTRVPVGIVAFEPAELGRAAAWFPLVGLLLGWAGTVLLRFVDAHLQSPLGALIVILAMVLVTGGLHEDGLADCADAFGGGWTREQKLRILKDSRIGSYGALALIFSVGLRVLLLASIPTAMAGAYLISAQTLSRWTPLVLSAALPSARGEGEGAKLARNRNWGAVVLGTLFAAAAGCALLRWSAWLPCMVVVLLTMASGAYYRRQIGGITGDCMGATIQIAEIAVYACGAWRA